MGVDVIGVLTLTSQNVNAFGAEWYVLSPAGGAVTKSSGSGGSYSY